MSCSIGWLWRETGRNGGHHWLAEVDAWAMETGPFCVYEW